MSHLPDQHPAHFEPLPKRARLVWRFARASYHHANRASHHVLGFTIKLVLLAYFLFALLFLGLRYTVLPHIDLYKAQIERLSSKSLGLPVAIERVYASWEGLRPHLFLGDVVIHDKNGRTALHLPSVSATISWWTLFSAKLSFTSLELGRPDLNIHRDQDGKLYVAGIYIDPNQGGDGKGLDWLLSQRQILINDGRLSWTDMKRGAPPLVLEDVNLTLRNEWQRHQAGLRARPPQEISGPLDLRADFKHPPFARKISDVRQWQGVLYAELADTDLAVWRVWINYPFEVLQGKGALRAWLDLDHGKLANFTADVHLSQLHARLAPGLDLLKLRSVSGRIAAREEFDQKRAAEEFANPSFGKHGHDISLHKFSLETEEGLTLVADSIEQSWRAPRTKVQESTRLAASKLDLRTLSELATRLPFSAAQRQMLRDFAPRGQVNDFSLQWAGSYPEVSSYRVKGSFQGLGLAAQMARPARAKQADLPAKAALPAIPGFENLSGSIDADQKGGQFNLDAHQFVLQMPSWFADPVLVFDQLAMRASWDLRNQDELVFAVQKMDVAVDGLKASLSGKHVLPLKAPPGKAALGRVDLKAEVESLSLNRIGRFLPLQTSEHLYHWLNGALEGGEARQVSLKLKGDLAHFPFHGKDAAAHGEFLVRGQLENAKLNYAPGVFGHDGVSPKWPQAEAINGYFVFDRARLEVFADNAKSKGAKLHAVKAVIPDLLDTDAQLEIDGSASAPLQTFVNYINASPVADWTGHFTENTRAEGAAKLNLKLKLPLAHAIDAKVQGSLQLQNNELQLMPNVPVLSAASGRVEFNERGVRLPGLTAIFAGGPLNLSGGSQADGNIVVKAVGSFSVDGLRRAFPDPRIQKITDHIQGGTRYQSQIIVKKRQWEVVFDSSMQGLHLNFPAPLRKAGQESMPLHFTQINHIQDDGTVRDEIKLSLGSALAARYQRYKGTDGVWHLQRGGIGVNAPPPEPESGLTINANMRALNVDAWRNMAAAINAAGKNLPQAEVAQEGGEGSQFEQLLNPEVLAANVNELIVLGKKLENVVVGASHQKGVWQANINSTQVAGHLTWFEGNSGRGLGRITSRLSSLIIPESAVAEVGDLLESSSATTQIPALDIIAENFELFNKKMGRLELQANNARVNGQREWVIKKLELDNPDANLSATGRWASREGVGNTSLNFTLSMKDAGAMLERFGFSRVLRAGEGKMTGDLNWRGLPFAFDIPSLSGNLKMELVGGQFLKVEPGAAKLLAVLSLQALPKLLKLDFHDVFSEGFAFDAITANAQISKGVLSTENLKMVGVNATVLMEGSADIAHETQNLYVVVVPEINVGTASMVYALAVNPVVGLGSFLAQMFLRNPLMKALTFQYQISGPWKEPLITKVEPRPQKNGVAPVPLPGAQQSK